MFIVQLVPGTPVLICVLLNNTMGAGGSTAIHGCARPPHSGVNKGKIKAPMRTVDAGYAVKTQIRKLFGHRGEKPKVILPT